MYISLSGKTMFSKKKKLNSKKFFNKKIFSEKKRGPIFIVANLFHVQLNRKLLDSHQLCIQPFPIVCFLVQIHIISDLIRKILQFGEGVKA